MAYFFTLLYLTTAYITPVVLFGPLGTYHIEVVLAGCAILASIPSLEGSGLLHLPQTYALLGISLAVVGSIASTGWLGGVPQICYNFLPIAAGFFLVALNCRKKWHFQLIVLSMFLCSVYFIVEGSIDLRNHVQVSPFIYAASSALPRLRGLGVVNDPNDFAQVMVSLIPLIFLWRTKSGIANLFILGIPIAVLITGMYLTHSRGASIALMVIALLGLRKKIGTVPAVVLAGVLMVAVTSAGWGGGRDINIDSGEGRLDAWAAGLQFIKSHPLFGIGYQNFAETYGITAHNSVMVCAAEIGLPGFFCWVCFLLSSFRFAIQMSNPPPASQEHDRSLDGGIPPAFDLWAAKRMAPPPGALQVAGASGHAPPALLRSGTVLSAPPEHWQASAAPFTADSSSVSPEELRRMAQLMMVSLAGFLTSAWFLSRALNLWLFMYCGMICAILQMSKNKGISVPRDPPSRLIGWSFGVGVLLLAAVYVLLRIHNIVG